MESSTTRISELPENISIQHSPVHIQPSQNHQMGFPPTISITQTKTNQIDQQATNYMPMNIHPNPYNNSQPQQPPNPMHPPQQQQQDPFSLNVPPQFHEQLSQIPQQRLSSRDIPMDTIQYTHDEEIQSNYIPRPSVKNGDYVRDYETTTEKNMREYETKKRNLVDLFFQNLADFFDQAQH